MKTIIIDTLGGDNGVKPIISAIKSFLHDFPEDKVIAVGKEEELQELKDVCEIVHAPYNIPMEASPLDVMRHKDSSLYVANTLLKEGKGDAVISAGSTGGLLTASTLLLKNAPNVKRAALVAPFPTLIKGKKVAILDIGANNENAPEELVQFATMGALYSQIVYKVEKPKIYLLSNGTEEGKGSPESKEAYKLLKDNPLFRGNIEARNALSGEADVVVTDGFTGNIFLKSSEGMAKMLSGMIKGAFKRNLWAMLGYLHVRKGIKDMTETWDYKSTGGAMLVGVNGVVVKAHGNSDEYSFRCALNVAKNLADNDLSRRVSEALEGKNG